MSPYIPNPTAWTSVDPGTPTSWDPFNNFAYYTYDTLGATYDDPTVQYDMVSQVISNQPATAWTPTEPIGSTNAQWTQTG